MHRFSHETHQGILQFRAEGQYSLDALQEAIAAAILGQSADDRPNLLLDVRRSGSLGGRRGEDVARFGRFLTGFADHLGPRFAVVVADDQQRHHLDAANRHIPDGARLRPFIFVDMLQAITWLTEASNRSAARAAQPLGHGLAD